MWERHIVGQSCTRRPEAPRASTDWRMRWTCILLVSALAASSARGQVEVKELEQAAPDGITVVDCPAVFTVPISVLEAGSKKGVPWSLQHHRCRGFEGLMIGDGLLFANRHGGIRLLIQAHLTPSFDRLMHGRVELLDRDKNVLLAREFAMEVEEGRWNSAWLKLGTIEDVSSIASLAFAVYSINED